MRFSPIHLLFLLPVLAALITARPAGADEQGQQVCCAAIAALFGRAPEIIKVLEDDGDIVTTRYNRPSDGKAWSHRCKIRGDRVIWAGDTGRWRDGPHDAKVTFSKGHGGVSITQVYSDGSRSRESYSNEQLQ